MPIKIKIAMPLTPTQNRNIIIVILTLLLFAVTLLKTGCNDDVKTTLVQTSKDTALIKEVNRLGQEVVSQKELVAVKTKELEKQLLANSNLKSINTHLKAMVRTSMTNVLAKYDVDSTQSIADTTVSFIPDTAFNPLNKSFSVTEKWYNLSGKVTRNGILLNNITINDSLTVNYGVKKTGFLNLKKENFIEIIHSNPNIETLSINNVTLKNEKKWYEKGITKFMAGAIVGGATIIYLIR